MWYCRSFINNQTQEFLRNVKFSLEFSSILIQKIYVTNVVPTFIFENSFRQTPNTISDDFADCRIDFVSNSEHRFKEIQLGILCHIGIFIKLCSVFLVDA